MLCSLLCMNKHDQLHTSMLMCTWNLILLILLNSNISNILHRWDDWLFGVCLYSRSETSDYICTAFIDGSIKLFSVADFMSSEVRTFVA